MAGELSNGEIARLEVRKALVDLDYVDFGQSPIAIRFAPRFAQP